MKSIIIDTNNDDEKYIQYDESKFEIEYNDTTDSIAIRYKDSFTIEDIPSENVKCIIQSYVKEPNFREPRPRFIMYRYDKSSGKWFLDVCYPNGQGFTRDKSISSCLDDETVFVSRERTIRHSGTNEEVIKDVIYYCVDPITFEVNSQIWSQVQNKIIPICSEEEYEANKNENETILEYTIRTRIDSVLKEMTKENKNLVVNESASFKLEFKPSEKKSNSNGENE